jgi:fibronectin type III domain protein
MRPAKILTGFLILLISFVSQMQGAHTITLAWDPILQNDLAGYRVHWGTASGDYTHETDVGSTTRAVVSNLTDGTTNFFAVTAYDIAGLESLPSNEVSYPNWSHLANISTRMNVGVNDNVLIGGFIVRGSQPKHLIVRALGPSLTAAGVTGAMANPMLELHDSTGALIASNDNWQTGGQASQISASGLAPSNALESAIIATLPSGNYTAIVRGVNSTTGIALVEVYELDSTTTRLMNASTRGRVGVNDDVLIGGFIVRGSQPKQLMVRAIGPSLAAAGVAGAMANPRLELHDSAGALIASNDNWQTGGQASQISASGLAPSNALESAIIATFRPGNYTAIVKGVNNATGVAMVEVYDLDP